MATTKPYRFLLFGTPDTPPRDLVQFVKVKLEAQHGFDFFFAMVHRPEVQPTPEVEYLPGEEPSISEDRKYHAHCVAHIQGSTDYETLLEGIVRAFALDVPTYGSAPVSFLNGESGKCNHLPSHLLYCLHDPDYLEYRKHKDPLAETCKIQYGANEFVRSSTDKLNAYLRKGREWLDSVWLQRREDQDTALKRVLSGTLRLEDVTPDQLVATTNALRVATLLQTFRRNRSYALERCTPLKDVPPPPPYDPTEFDPIALDNTPPVDLGGNVPSDQSDLRRRLSAAKRESDRIKMRQSDIF